MPLWDLEVLKRKEFGMCGAGRVEGQRAALTLRVGGGRELAKEAKK